MRRRGLWYLIAAVTAFTVPFAFRPQPTDPDGDPDGDLTAYLDMLPIALISLGVTLVVIYVIEMISISNRRHR